MITLIVPAYNEAETIEKAISSISQKLKEMKIKYRIIIAEDGSTDGTYEIACKIAKNDKHVKISHSDKRLGRGLALKNCNKLVKGKFVVYMDADLSTKLDSLDLMIKELKYNDVVVGSRYITGSKYKRSPLRLFLSKGFNFIRMVFFPELKIKDAQCGFKGFRKNVFVEINKRTKDNGWFWDTEFLIRAKEMGLKIKEIPIEWKENRKTSLKLIKDVLKMSYGLIRLRLEK